MGSGDLGLTRRRILGTVAGAAMAATAGCGLFDVDPEPAPAPDPLQPLLDEALGLAAAYDRVAIARPELAGRLTPLAADHRAHAAELTRMISTDTRSAAPGTSAAPDPGETLADLRTTERNAQRTATLAARTVPAGRAALVGSIAACRATHVEALR